MGKLAWIVVCLALVMVCLPAFAQEREREQAKGDQSHEGKVVRAGDGRLTMTDKTGGAQHTHMVPREAKITLDGKECKLEDLKAGFEVKVTTKGDAQRTVTKIEAKSQNNEKK
jgi:hypothetical protein